MDLTTRLYEFYPAVAAVLTVEHDGRRNAMAMAWHTILSFRPPLFGALVSPKRYTYDLLVQAGAYAVNFLPLERADLIARLGRQSGRDLDKFAAFGIEVIEDEETLAPVLKDAYAAYECRVVDRHTYGDHDLFVGEIVRIHRQEGAFTSELRLDLERVRPALYVGANLYVAPDPGSLVRHLGR